MVMKCLFVADHSEQEMHQKNIYLSGLYYILLKLTSMWWLRILYKTSLLTEPQAFLKSVSSWCAATLHSRFSSGIWSLFAQLCWNQQWWFPVISPHGLIFVRGILNRILYVAGRPGIRILVGLRDFSVFQNVQTGSVAHPGYQGSFLGLKWLGR